MDIFALTTQETLDRISRHCPEALSAYLNCINRADTDGKIFFSKSFVNVEMSMGWCAFRNNIKKLALENLLEWHPFNDGIMVTLPEVSPYE